MPSVVFPKILFIYGFKYELLEISLIIYYRRDRQNRMKILFMKTLKRVAGMESKRFL